jgi:hypothetical protein
MPVILDCDFIKKGEDLDIPLGFNATCTISEQVGDPVVLHDSIDGQVERLASNVYDKLVIGIIASKSSDTECFVVVAGVLDPIGPGGYDQALNTVWVSPTGSLTTTKPVTGHLQVLGRATSSTGIVVSIENRKTVQA